jgi:predicted glycoside hydrolase/deacetylase ChbG (UPF0249 family)
MPVMFLEETKFMKILIVNADDLGLSEAINESIAIAHDQGIVTSTTLLVAREATTKAVRIARERPGLGVGLHLDLDELFRFESDGHFGLTIHDINQEVCAYYTTERKDLLRDEINRQIDRFLEFGLVPTHLDGHHNIHIFPGILPLVVEIIHAYGLDKIRFSRDFYVDHLEEYETCRTLLDKANIRYPKHCFDLDEVLCDPGRLPAKVFEGVKEGVTETVVHTTLPGKDDIVWRIRQFNFVTSQAATQELATRGIRLINYSQF